MRKAKSETPRAQRRARKGCQLHSTECCPFGTRWATNPVDGSVKVATSRPSTSARISGKEIARHKRVPPTLVVTCISRRTGPQEITRIVAVGSSRRTAGRPRIGSNSCLRSPARSESKAGFMFLARYQISVRFSWRQYHPPLLASHAACGSGKTDPGAEGPGSCDAKAARGRVQSHPEKGRAKTTAPSASSQARRWSSWAVTTAAIKVSCPATRHENCSLERTGNASHTGPASGVAARAQKIAPTRMARVPNLAFVSGASSQKATTTRAKVARSTTDTSTLKSHARKPLANKVLADGRNRPATGLKIDRCPRKKERAPAESGQSRREETQG